MFFRVQNLGPLRDAEVDLSKDLILLAGPNNSGKTYLAWSVYGLHRWYRDPAPAVLDHWVAQLLDSPEHAIDLGELWAKAGPELLDGIAREYLPKLHLCFAAASDQFAAASVSLRGGSLLQRAEVAVIPGPVTFALRVGLGSERLELTVLFTTLGQATLPAEMQAQTTAAVVALADSDRASLHKHLGTSLRQVVLKRLLPKCALFPAERIAVNIFAKELALKRTELVDEMVDADLDAQGGASLELIRRKAGRYPWPIRDSLRVANDLANLGKEKGPFAPLADELETAVLGGAVHLSDTGEMLFSPTHAADSRLPMHLTASVVKSLASLVFYFRHLARPGDFIIIDEPELNLHPDNQRKVTRLLAKAVRQGIKIMMSTHSDYVLRELNHMIMLSKLPEGEAQTLGYDPACALSPAQLGVYLFDDQHAEPVEVGETGFSIRTIDAVVNQLNADEQRLYARIGE